MSKRIFVFLFFGLILVSAAEWDLHKRVLAPIRKLDSFWVDFCIGNAGNRIGNPAITMVRITDDYEPVPIGVDASNNNGPKSLTRLDYATFLYAIGKMNPRSVSFMPTPEFEQKSVLNQTSLYPLRDAALQLPRMTIGTVISEEGKPQSTLAYPAIVAKGDTSALPEIRQTLIKPDPDFLTNGNPAFVTNDSRNTLAGNHLRIQLVARQGEKVVPGFALASVANQYGIRLKNVVLDLESRSPKIQVGDYFSIPVAKDGTMALPSHSGITHSMYDISTGPNGKQKRDYHFASLKVEDVALAAERSDSIAKTLFDEFPGKFESLATNLVLLGYDRTSDRTIKASEDEWLSPMTATARAIATIQSGRHITRWELPIRCAVYAAIFVIGGILLNLKKKSALFILGVGIVSLVSLVLIFKQTLTWTPPAAILGLFGIMFLVSLFGRSAKKAEEEPTAEA